MTDNRMELPMEKKSYAPPTLIVHGTLEEITQMVNFNQPGGTAGSHVNPPT